MPDLPPVYNPPQGQSCVTCVYGITGRWNYLECHFNPPAVQGQLGVWAQVGDNDWCGEWAQK
jgi:hypothetical protein